MEREQLGRSQKVASGQNAVMEKDRVGSATPAYGVVVTIGRVYAKTDGNIR